MPASLPRIFSNSITSKDKYLDAIYMYCSKQGWAHIWFITDIVILVTGVLANAALLWLFLRERKSLSTSRVGSAPNTLCGILFHVMQQVVSAGLSD